MWDLKVWPNVPPDVKFNSSTPGKIESTTTEQPILSNNTNQNTKPASLQPNRQQITSKPLNITWNDDTTYPILDELSRIAKVRRIHFH